MYNNECGLRVTLVGRNLNPKSWLGRIQLSVLMPQCFVQLLALVSLILISASAFLFKPEPASAAKVAAKSEVTIGQVISDKKLMYFCLVLFVLGFGIWNPPVHNVEVAEDNGLSDNKATNANLFGFSAGAIIGRPLAAKALAITGRRCFASLCVQPPVLSHCISGTGFP